jgi:hypothetical protein
MRAMRILLGSMMMFGIALGLAILPQRAASGSPQMAGGGIVPAFHREVPGGPLPVTLSPKQFDDPMVQNSYAIAARIKKTLYQQPCYCHCDRSQGHGSLLDCYVSKHASGCEICIRETFYASQQLAKGKTAAQIRDGINRGDWEKADVSKYRTYPPAK